ncbi:hypothetical protein ASF09_11700 [Sphingomonas sp. Leaf242]|nr:hypothetical protein ASF09_11700 [Sphingomonas sp. Leaf242]
MELGEWAGSIGISALTAAGIMWTGAKVVASKWLDSRFDSRLEAVKLEGQKQLEAVKLEGQSQLEAARHEHTGYIERMKFERSNLLDRSAKLNQREFEIIPAIWNAATSAHYAVLRLISRWQEGTNIHKMTEAHFEALLKDSPMKEHEKDELRGKTGYERTTYYSELQGWLRLREANEAVVRLNIATEEGTIFLQPETHDRIQAITDSIRKTYQYFRNNMVFELDEKLEDDPIDRYREVGDDEYQALAKYLRERYWTGDDKTAERSA